MLLLLILTVSFDGVTDDADSKLPPLMALLPTLIVRAAPSKVENWIHTFLSRIRGVASGTVVPLLVVPRKAL